MSCTLSIYSSCFPPFAISQVFPKLTKLTFRFVLKIHCLKLHLFWIAIKFWISVIKLEGLPWNVEVLYNRCSHQRCCQSKEIWHNFWWQHRHKVHNSDSYLRIFLWKLYDKGMMIKAFCVDLPRIDMYKTKWIILTLFWMPYKLFNASVLNLP